MTAAGAVQAGRRAAEALMIDACTITRGAGSTAFDPNRGEYVTTPGATVYSGRCRVKPQDNADRVVEAGGTNVSLFPYVVSVPVDATAYQVDDLVTVTSAALDPAMQGLVLRVKQIAAGSQITSRRLGAEVNAG